MADNYIVPLSVSKTAKRGLFLSEKFGLSTSSINRAATLSNNDTIDVHMIARMVSYFNKADQLRSSDTFGNAKNPTKSYAEWLTWGGESGKAWSNKMWKTYKHELKAVDNPQTNSNVITLSGKAFASTDDVNPAQKHIKFIFTDYLPNANKQGVPVEEAENVLKTGLYMPVKVNFQNGPKGHARAIPIGPIIGMINEDSKIVGEAVVWSTEFPDIAEYLDIASASEGGVQFSWELAHSNSTTDDNGITWLRNIVVMGITMVNDPAYKGRTPLISVAEELSSMELEEALAELANANDKISELESQLAENTSMQDKLSALETEVISLRSFKEDVEAEAAKAEKLSTRRSKLSEAGITFTDDEFSTRSGIIFGMTDDVFDLYVSDIKSRVSAASVNKQKTSVAGVDNSIPLIPDPQLDGEDKKIKFSYADLGKALREKSKRENK